MVLPCWFRRRSGGWARNGRAVKALPYGAAGETRKTKILKTNLECPLESMRSKNGVGREADNPNFVAPSQDLSHSLPTGYVASGRFAEVALSRIILQ